MRSDKAAVSSGITRQKIIAVLFVIVLIFLIWQIWSLFRGSSSSAAPITPSASTANKPPINATSPSGPPGAVGPLQPAAQPMPQPAQLKEDPVLSVQDLQMMEMQKRTEAKYLSTLNELQLLKLSREIAETNQAIAAAKLSTVVAEKKIVDLLKPPPPMPPAAYTQALNPNPVIVAAPPPPPPPPQIEVNYSVISVSKLLNKWRAVMGYQGNLYQVSIGDMLPPDESKVISIDRTGVILEKNGAKKKVSLVPII